MSTVRMIHMCYVHTHTLGFFLHVADPPRITTHPLELKVVVQGKPAKFTIQAIGTEPLRYNWQWNLSEEEGEWQPCCAEWCDGATLTIPSVQKSNEGSYRCVISNCAGSQASKPAKLEVGWLFTIYGVTE